MRAQPGAASIMVWARRLKVRLRSAKKPINRVGQVTASIQENSRNDGDDNKSFISAHSKNKRTTGRTACRREHTTRRQRSGKRRMRQIG